MSTRCNIVLVKENKKICLYRHHDGYPEGAGEDLQEYLDEHFAECNDDISTLAKNMIAWKDLCISPQDYDHSNLDEPTDNINDDIHSDIEYLYVIDMDVRGLSIFKVPYNLHHDALNNGTFTFEDAIIKYYCENESKFGAVEPEPEPTPEPSDEPKEDGAKESIITIVSDEEHLASTVNLLNMYLQSCDIDRMYVRTDDGQWWCENEDDTEQVQESDIIDHIQELWLGIEPNLSVTEKLDIMLSRQ